MSSFAFLTKKNPIPLTVKEIIFKVAGIIVINNYMPLLTPCFEALFTQVTVEDSTNNSKYIIYMYGRKSAGNYSYRNLHVVTMPNGIG